MTTDPPLAEMLRKADGSIAKDALRSILYAIEHTDAGRNEIHKIAREALGVPCGDGGQPSAANLRLEVEELRRQVEAMRAAMLLAEAANCGQHGFPDHLHREHGIWDSTNQLCEECAAWNSAMGRTS